jgi:hypothetical protein
MNTYSCLASLIFPFLSGVLTRKIHWQTHIPKLLKVLPNALRAAANNQPTEVAGVPFLTWRCGAMRERGVEKFGDRQWVDQGSAWGSTR